MLLSTFCVFLENASMLIFRCAFVYILSIIFSFAFFKSLFAFSSIYLFPIIILFNFLILQQGTQFAFELHLSVKKPREKLSPLCKSSCICSRSFSKAIRGSISLNKPHQRAHLTFQKLQENSRVFINQQEKRNKKSIREFSINSTSWKKGTQQLIFT